MSIREFVIESFVSDLWSSGEYEVRFFLGSDNEGDGLYEELADWAENNYEEIVGLV